MRKLRLTLLLATQLLAQETAHKVKREYPTQDVITTVTANAKTETRDDQQVNISVPSSCLTKDVLLTDCILDDLGNVKTCVGPSHIAFRQGCGMIIVVPRVKLPISK